MMIQSLERLKASPKNMPYLENALQCLAEHEQDAAPARFEFEGGFLMLQEGDTKSVDDGDYEAHKKYLDVQIVLEGSETVIWNDIQKLEESMPYDEGKDKVMYSGAGDSMTFSAGTCYICWPEDGHKACRHMDKQTHFRKAVVKLSI